MAGAFHAYLQEFSKFIPLENDVSLRHFATIENTKLLLFKEKIKKIYA